MAKGINDLGNGNGLIYITDINLNVIESLINDDAGKNTALSRSLLSLPITGNIIPSSIIDIQTAANAGSDVITELRADGINLLDATIAITDANESATAIALASAVNTSTQILSAVKYKAQAIGTTVLLTPTNITDYESLNGVAVIILFTGASVIPNTTLNNGVNGSGRRALETNAISEIIDPTNGVRVLIDADYSAVGDCSGDQPAIEGDLSNAVEITEYFLHWSMSNKLDSVENVDVLNNTVKVSKYSLITKYFINVSSAQTINSIATDTYLVNRR